MEEPFSSQGQAGESAVRDAPDSLQPTPSESVLVLPKWLGVLTGSLVPCVYVLREWLSGCTSISDNP